ncbi:MAG: 4-hydroxy-tetrahydrodipicolinate reductase [Clostridia bacterium]|nr:4-hydroxy-tetrahydrodipicolinate reductase [Clostridia bacterium]
MRILLVGICGRMGRTVVSLCRAGCGGMEVVCGVDKDPRPADFDVPCYPALAAVTPPFDCIVDFSSADETASLLAFAAERGRPLVLATTGQSAKEKRAVMRTAKEIPIFFAPNFSIGAALLCSLAVEAAKVLAGADIEIVETHRRGKKDAPSGTALAIADALCKEARPFAAVACGRPKARAGDIGIHALRLGQTVGKHEVLIAAEDESILLSHTAQNSTLYAKGALRAAAFLSGKPPGLYTMRDLLPTLTTPQN